ncbi:hypothetical protein [Dysosmobacter sp. Sow4_B12]|uniref:hypothetical protein n=1 Tax=Dysosmobacter sp. Sow4_B12 TaxID=3438777 RepID=UPI003F8DFD9D
MKRVVSLALALILALSLVGCSGSKPDTVVTTFCSAVQAFDFEKAATCMENGSEDLEDPYDDAEMEEDLSSEQVMTYKLDYRWLSTVYESVRPTDNTGHLIWSALGPKTLELVQQNVTAIGIAGNVEVLETDADLIEQLIKGATGDPQKLSKKIQINLEAIIRGVIDDPTFVELGERLEKLKEEHEKGLMTSVIFLKKLLELARDTVAAVKKANAAQPEPTREEKGKAALTELFKEARNAKTPVIVERIVDEIDGIVRIVRFPGWQDTETGRREISMELYGIFARKKLFDKDLVEKAYKYVEQYY